MAISAADRRSIRANAKGCCEYCRMANDWEPFFPYHIEHIIARQHGGSDEPNNLAFSCHHCNFIKGPNLTSIDPDTGEVVELFNPRQQKWEEHFRFARRRIEGLSSTGRTTVFLLQMNSPHRVELRSVNQDRF